MEEKTVRLFIAAPADRDTVRQGRAKENPGDKNQKGYVEVIFDGRK